MAALRSVAIPIATGRPTRLGRRRIDTELGQEYVIELLQLATGQHHLLSVRATKEMACQVDQTGLINSSVPCPLSLYGPLACRTFEGRAWLS